MITQGTVLKEVQDVRCIEFAGIDVVVMVFGKDDAEAVARLIAAAPALLDVCKEISNIAIGEPMNEATLKRAENAIAEATQ